MSGIAVFLFFSVSSRPAALGACGHPGRACDFLVFFSFFEAGTCRGLRFFGFFQLGTWFTQLTVDSLRVASIHPGAGRAAIKPRKDR